jgi:uncharacterized protein involved in outer membrane biogenesis
MGHLLGVIQFLFKFLFYLLIFIVVICLIFMLMMLNFDVNKHKDSIQEAFKRETGLDLVIQGPIQAEFFPDASAHFSRVEIVNETQETRMRLFIEDVQVNIDVFSLFTNVVKVNNFDARGMNIQLFEGKSNKLNILIDSFSGQVVSSFREISIPSFVLKSGNNAISGDFKLMLLSNVPIVQGNFSSRQFNLDFRDPKGSPAKFFSNKPMALDWFNNLNGQLFWHFDNLFLGQISIEDTNIQLIFKDKNLEMVPRGKVAGGDLTGKIQVQKRENAFQVTTDLKLKNAIASEFFQQFWKNAALLNGKLDVQFEGKSSGGELSTWMSHLTGRGLISIKNMQIQDRDIDTRYVDIFAAIWKSLNPSKKGTSLECVAMLLKAEDGKVTAKETIAMQTGDVYALGAGNVDLKNETLDLTFDLYPRNQVNLDRDSFDQVVHVKGTLSKPEWIKSPKGMIKEGGTVLLGAPMGGISVLAEKMLKIVSQKSSPCQQVLAEAFEETND